MRRWIGAATGLAAAATFLALGLPADQAGAVGTPVPVQLIAMNDFHGRIDAYTNSDSALPGYPDPVGGAAYIPPLMSQLRSDFATAGGDPANSVFVGAGDLISASPFESSSFEDEPSIEVLNALGLDFSSVGNHEFDRGQDELDRIQNGGCVGTPGVDSCFRDDQFAGADFPYLAANVIDDSTGDPILPPYQIKEFAGPDGPIQMGFIGIVTKTVPTLVSPAGIEGLTFADEADTINKYAAELKDQGVEAIGVMIHEGGTEAADTTYQDCESGFSGPIVDINSRTSADVDLIMSAHTHFAYTCVLTDPAGNPRHVTEAGSYGRLLTDINLQLDSETKDVIRTPDNDTVAAQNHPVVRTGVTPDPTVQAIVQYWLDKSAEKKNEPVGTITADIVRSVTRDGESSLGNLIADGQLAATASADTGEAVVAFMNPGGVRTDLLYASSGDGDPDGNVTYGDLFNVQPFGNTVNTTTLTGAQIKEALEQQWTLNADGSEKFLQLSVSEGFTYVFDRSRPIGDRIDPRQIVLNGEVIDPGASYRVTANSFLTAGGDGFTALSQGSDTITGPVDVDAFVTHFAANSPVTPPALGRVVEGPFLPSENTADLGFVSVDVPALATGETGTIDAAVGNAGPDDLPAAGTLTVSVTGPITLSPSLSAAQAVARTVSDDVPGTSGLALASADAIAAQNDVQPLAQAPGCTVAGDVATCPVPALAAGSQVTIPVEFTLDAGAQVGEEFSITLTVAGPAESADPDTSNNTVVLTGTIVDDTTPPGGGGGGPIAGGPGGALAYTGVELQPQLVAAGMLLVAGAAFCVAGRARRRAVAVNAGTPSTE